MIQIHILYDRVHLQFENNVCFYCVSEHFFRVDIVDQKFYATCPRIKIQIVIFRDHFSNLTVIFSEISKKLFIKKNNNNNLILEKF